MNGRSAAAWAAVDASGVHPPLIEHHQPSEKSRLQEEDEEYAAGRCFTEVGHARQVDSRTEYERSDVSHRRQRD